MHRFFVDKIIGQNQTVLIENPTDVKHITKSLRVRIGESLEIVDSSGQEFVVEVINLDDVVTCQIIEQSHVDRESNLSIDLYQGLAKGSKMELIIQKAVELGVANIIPVSMKRSIVKLDPKSSKKKNERYQAIADEAAKQSKRGVIPQVKDVVDMKTINALPYDLILIAYELESQKGLRETLRDFKGKSIAVFIGPEGGFEEEEVDQILSLGGHSVSLGKRILRTETAGMMLISILQYDLGDVQ